MRQTLLDDLWICYTSEQAFTMAYLYRHCCYHAFDFRSHICVDCAIFGYAQQDKAPLGDHDKRLLSLGPKVKDRRSIPRSRERHYFTDGSFITAVGSGGRG